MPALTIDEFEALFESVTDRSYWRPLQKLGEGQGYEIWTQTFRQLAAASQSIEEETQGIYTRPFSGQTNPPASGEESANVTLTVQRPSAGTTVVIDAGMLFEEIAQDHSLTGPVDVHTGRRYYVPRTTLGPADASVSTTAVAERPGFGGNNPQPNTITAIVQSGIGMNGTGATVSQTQDHFQLVAGLGGDALLPQHIGAYVRFTAGTNNGRQARAIAWLAPTPDVDNGTLILEEVYAFQVTTITGAFTVGEYVQQASGSDTFVGVVYSAVSFGGYTYLVIAPNTFNDAFATGGSDIVGQSSGALANTAAGCTTLEAPSLVTDNGTAAWTILGFESDLGITSTNALSPTGGRLPQLDEEGLARDLPRAPGETDDVYRERVARAADTISPAAIRRVANRILVATANVTVGVTLREPTFDSFRGVYGDLDFFDYDPIVRSGADKWKTLLSFEEARAFFIVELPFTADGEFGVPHDDCSPYFFPNAYDTTGWLTFHDGYPLTSATRRQAIWAAINSARAGGVGFDLYEQISADVV